MNWTTIGELRRRQGGGPAAPVEANPFKRDSEGKIPSISALTRAIQTDPAKARTLCRAAGENPNSWFPENPK